MIEVIFTRYEFYSGGAGIKHKHIDCPGKFHRWVENKNPNSQDKDLDRSTQTTGPICALIEDSNGHMWYIDTEYMHFKQEPTI